MKFGTTARTSYLALLVVDMFFIIAILGVTIFRIDSFKGMFEYCDNGGRDPQNAIDWVACNKRGGLVAIYVITFVVSLVRAVVAWLTFLSSWKMSNNNTAIVLLGTSIILLVMFIVFLSVFSKERIELPIGVIGLLIQIAFILFSSLLLVSDDDYYGDNDY